VSQRENNIPKLAVIKKIEGKNLKKILKKS
jgi:hypothetical protein